MSNINGVGQTNPLNHIYKPATAKPATETQSQTPARSSDRVDLGDTKVALMSKLKANDIRADKVQDIRAQIEAGTYESDAKLNGAVDKLMDDLV